MESLVLFLVLSLSSVMIDGRDVSILYRSGSVSFVKSDGSFGLSTKDGCFILSPLSFISLIDATVRMRKGDCSLYDVGKMVEVSRFGGQVRFLVYRSDGGFDIYYCRFGDLVNIHHFISLYLRGITADSTGL